MSKVNHTIVAVVTIKTILPKTFRMLGDEIRSGFGVTGDTIDPLGAKPVLPMAVRTGNRRFIATGLMADQTESSELCVIDVAKGQRADDRVLPPVLDVTVIASVGGRQETVQDDALGSFFDYLDVTL